MKPWKVILSFPIAATAIFATGISTNAATSYYSSITSTSSGSSLASSLHSLISSDTSVISYSNLYTAAYPTTDCLPGTNIVWDIYSNEIYDLSSDSGSSATAEGAGFNREHTVPQSWFSKASPMVSDIYHIYPTDIYVNNQRSSYMYDDVSSASKTYGNGSKLGTGSVYSSKTTFEATDEYKGDIARGYFYMAIRYSDKLSSWTAGEAQNVFTSSYPYLTDDAISVFTKWAHEDPVSDKEMLRNEATYALQGNRNPFIDHPEWVDTIWENSYTDSTTNTEYSLSDVISAISSLSSSSSSDSVYSAYNKYCRLTVADKANVTNDSTLFSYVESKSGTSTDLDSYWVNVLSTYNSTYSSSSSSSSTTTEEEATEETTTTTTNASYTKVTSSSELSAGDNVIVVYEDSSVALSTTQNTSNRGYESVTISSDTIASISDSVQVLTLVDGSSSGTYRLETSDGYYLTVPSNANKLTTTTYTNTKTEWTITPSSSTTTLKNGYYTSRYLQYNSTSSIFAAYKSTQKDVTLFKYNGSSQSSTEAVDDSEDLSSYTSSFEELSTNAALNLSYDTETTTTNNTTTNTASKSSFSSTSGSLDDYISYAAAKGSASTSPAVYSNIVRVYQNGGTFTVSAENDATITSITLGSAMSTKVTYSVDGGDTSSSNSISAGSTLTLSDISATDNVLFTCVGTTSKQRLYVNYLSVTYQVGEVTTTTTYTYSDVSIDFSGTISSELYTALSKATFGIRIKSGSGSYTYYTITPQASGSNCVIAKNVSISSSNYSTSYTAQVYVLLDGSYYYMDSISYSVDSLVSYYISNADSLGVSSDMLAALNAWE